MQHGFAAGEEVLGPLAAEALAGADVEAFAVGGEPDGHVMGLAGLAADRGEGDLTLLGRGPEHVVAEVGHIRVNRRWRLAHSRSGAFTGWVGESASMYEAFGMARSPRIPHQLTTRPFSLREAREAGLTL